MAKRALMLYVIRPIPMIIFGTWYCVKKQKKTKTTEKVWKSLFKIS